MVKKGVTHSPFHKTHFCCYPSYPIKNVKQINMGICGVAKINLINSLQVQVLEMLILFLFLDKEAMWKWAVLLTFQRNLFPPSSGVKMTGVRIVTAYGQSDGTMITHNHGSGIGNCGILANNTCKKPLPHTGISQKQNQHHH
jgi:hypothetical protein